MFRPWSSLGSRLLLPFCLALSAFGLGACRQGPPENPADAPLLLKIHGSNTMGAKLTPRLAAGWLRSLGADTVFEMQGTQELERYVLGRLEEGWKRVEVFAYGSNTGFDDLAWNRCDIAMASKPIDDAHHGRLLGKGDMRSPECETVAGLDGLVLVVHPKNPLASLSLEQIRSIYLGRIADWALLPGGRPGLISFHSRDANSGTYDVFREEVMGKRDPVSGCRYHESNAKVAKAVAEDERAIGYVPVAQVGDLKPVALAGRGGLALKPEKLSIVTEDYPLTRRLYFYSPADPENPNTHSFLRFVKGEKGQRLVEETGFLAQTLRMAKAPSAASHPEEYRDALDGALRVGVNFRFRQGGFQPDAKALQDAHRLTAFLDETGMRACGLVLLGFSSDSTGPKRNLDHSQRRAGVMGDHLRERFGIRAATFGRGSTLPLASGFSVPSLHRNNRVEVWLRCRDGA